MSKGVTIRSGLQIGPESCFIRDFKVLIDEKCYGQKAGNFMGHNSKLVNCAKLSSNLQAGVSSFLLI